MSQPPRPHAAQTSDVNWDTPELRELLGKIEGLRLDNRGMFKPRPVRIKSFWPAQRDIGTGSLTANDGNGHWTVVTGFPLDPGSALTVELQVPDVGMDPAYLCEVLQSRPGQRAEDEGATPPVWVNYLSARRADKHGASRMPTDEQR